MFKSFGKAKSSRESLTEHCEEKSSVEFFSSQQTLKCNKSEEWDCHYYNFSKNGLTLKEEDICNIKTDPEIKNDKPEFEDCLESISTLNVKNSNSENEKIDHSKLFLLAKDFSDEEISKKFQELNFAFKMDFSTIENRLCFLYRIKNQAEMNLENEFESFRVKLQNFQLLFDSINLCNKDRLNLVLNLSKGLNFLENAVTQLTEITMTYGYTKHEAEFLKFIFIMVENVKNIEKMKNKALKIAERFKSEAESARSLNRKDCDIYPLRRRSFSIPSLESSLRKTKFEEFSPATPGLLIFNKENLSFIKTERNLNKSSTRTSCLCNDDISTLCKNDFGNNKNISRKAEFEDQWSSEVIEPLSSAKKSSVDFIESESVNQLKELLKDFTQSLTTEETLNVFYCLRKIFKWNKMLLKATRFRWPEKPFQYASFYVTWYIIIVLFLFFLGGFFIGFNGWFIYMRLNYLLPWLTVFTSYILIRRFYRFIIPFICVMVLALIFCFFLLTKIILPQLTELETNALLKVLGLIFEVRYFNGPPPI